jgi:hypothetical protein
MHPPSDFLEEAVTFLHVVAPTGGHHVRPFVASAATARYDVIDCVGVFEAVRAPVPVAQEQGPARQRRGSYFRGQAYHVVQTHDGRDRHGDRTRTTDRGYFGDGDGFGPAGEE